MAKLTDEMKEMIKNQACFVATASKAGMPNVGVKGSVTVLDDETIAFAEVVGKTTYENLKANPVAAIIVSDRASLSGYRFVGKASLEYEGPVYDQFTEQLKKIGIPKITALVKVKIDEIYDMSVKNAGNKIG